MACHRHGYVGLVRLEDDRLDIAAALDAKAIKELGSLNRLAEHILMAANLPVPEALIDADWHGTGRLTQFPKQVAAERCFFIGDAAGYDEPFTGEGIAYAFASARAVAPIVLDCLKNGRESDAMQAWTETHQGIIMKRSRLCRRISRLVRYPTFVGVAVRLLALAPSLANPVVRSLNASFETKLSTSATAERQR
jgi:flavin-dependent dehydrogenase